MASSIFKSGDKVRLRVAYPAAESKAGDVGTVVTGIVNGSEPYIRVYWPKAGYAVSTYLWRLEKLDGLLDI